MSDRAAVLTSRVAEEWLQTYGEMRYEHYQSKASIARVKTAASQVARLQSAAIKAALDGLVLPGVHAALDELIDPIIHAADSFRTAHEEENLRDKRLMYKLVPQRRVLCTAEMLVETACGELVKRLSELAVYDIPLEQSMQRELLMNPGFEEHLEDWGEVMRLDANHGPMTLHIPPSTLHIPPSTLQHSTGVC